MLVVTKDRYPGVICKECGQASDWIGTESGWRPVHDRVATRALYECDRCGNRQLIR